MIEARIKAAEMVRHDIPKEHQTRRPFRSKLQQTLLRKRRTMEAALRDAVGKKGISMLQLTCMYDLGITTSRNLSSQDQELLLDTPEWKALLQAEIQSSKNQLDSMAKKQTRRCEHQAKRQEAQEYLRDKKDPASFVVTRTLCKRPRNWCYACRWEFCGSIRTRQRLRKQWRRRYAKLPRRRESSGRGLTWPSFS